MGNTDLQFCVLVPAVFCVFRCKNYELYLIFFYNICYLVSFSFQYRQKLLFICLFLIFRNILLYVCQDKQTMTIFKTHLLVEVALPVFPKNSQVSKFNQYDYLTILYTLLLGVSYRRLGGNILENSEPEFLNFL